MAAASAQKRTKVEIAEVLEQEEVCFVLLFIQFPVVVVVIFIKFSLDKFTNFLAANSLNEFTISDLSIYLRLIIFDRHRKFIAK